MWDFDTCLVLCPWWREPYFLISFLYFVTSIILVRFLQGFQTIRHWATGSEFQDDLLILVKTFQKGERECSNSVLDRK